MKKLLLTIIVCLGFFSLFGFEQKTTDKVQTFMESGTFLKYINNEDVYFFPKVNINQIQIDDDEFFLMSASFEMDLKLKQLEITLDDNNNLVITRIK